MPFRGCDGVPQRPRHPDDGGNLANHDEISRWSVRNGGVTLPNMSIPVDLDRLAETLTDRPLGYVITVGGDFHAHAVAVDARLEDDEFTIATAGRTTRRNAGEHPQVTLLWPPREPGGYSLIVDGRARVDAAGLHVVPSRAAAPLRRIR
jgi:hypothetical protein